MEKVAYEVKSLIQTCLGVQANQQIAELEGIRVIAVESEDELAVALVDGMIEKARERYRAADRWLKSFTVVV